jgi:hypothetical protein
MIKRRFSIAHEDEELRELVNKTDHKILARWAIDCAEHVLPYFEEKYPNDPRPRIAIQTLREWIDTGKFSMSVIRKASLDAHAAAREVIDDSPARSAARAAGQAVATAHVSSHAYGSAVYAQQAIHRASSPEDAEANAKSEHDWQYKHLLKLTERS